MHFAVYVSTSVIKQPAASPPLSFTSNLTSVIHCTIIYYFSNKSVGFNKHRTLSFVMLSNPEGQVYDSQDRDSIAASRGKIQKRAS